MWWPLAWIRAGWETQRRTCLHAAPGKASLESKQLTLTAKMQTCGPYHSHLSEQLRLRNVFVVWDTEPWLGKMGLMCLVRYCVAGKHGWYTLSGPASYYLPSGLPTKNKGHHFEEICVQPWYLLKIRHFKHFALLSQKRLRELGNVNRMDGRTIKGELYDRLALWTCRKTVTTVEERHWLIILEN